MDYLNLILAGSATALATGLGVVPVFLLNDRTVALRAGMWGFAAGTMAVAAVVGLLEPALTEGSTPAVLAGFLIGVAFMLGTRRLLEAHEPQVGGLQGANVRSSVLVFSVLFVHSAPEGMAIGTAYASHTAGLGAFVILAIALQNIPEGTSVAIPMARAGFSRWRQFWAAVATSIPQPVMAVAAFALVDTVTDLLPISFGFAAGAMLALVIVELLPKAFAAGVAGAVAGLLIGGGLMAALGDVFGV